MTENTSDDDLDKRHARAKKKMEIARADLKRQIIERRSEKLSTYEGADRRSRTFRDWRPGNQSGNQAVLNDLPTLLARARAGRRDSWIIRSYIQAMRRMIIGTGITVQSNARDPETGEPLEEFNRKRDALWQRYKKKKEWVDIEKRRNFLAAQRFACDEWSTVGTAKAIIGYKRARQGMVGACLQFFEPEMLDDRKREADNGNEIRGGIEIDTYGAPVAYHVHQKEHPMEVWTGDSVRVDASRVLDVGEPDRARQTRCVTPLAPVLKKIRHLRMTDQYELIARRMLACISGVIERNPRSYGGGFDIPGLPNESGEEEDQYGAQKLQLEPGMFPRLQEGEELKPYQPNRPGGDYMPFVKTQLREVGAGTGLDYNTIARDYSDVNYSSLRQARLDNWAETDPLQLLFINDFCRPFRERWTDYAVLEGLLDAPGYEQDAATRAMYLQDEWRGPEKQWVDPSKMAAAKKVLRTLGLTTHRDELNEQGQDWRETFQQLADENELAEQLGIVLGETGGGAPGPGQGSTNEDTQEPSLDDGDADDLAHHLLEAFEKSGVPPQLAAYALDYDEDAQ